MSNKLDYFDLEEIAEECGLAIQKLNQKPTHANKCIMLVLLDLKTKTDRKMCGLKKVGYSFKIKPMEVQALLYVRNEFKLVDMLQSHGITNLLFLNK